jgi:hypothetical protein
MMSEQQQQQQTKHRLTRHDVATILRYWHMLFRTRHDSKAFEQVTEQLAQESSVPVQDIPVVRNAFRALRDVPRDAQIAALVDRYLVGSMGVIDLILLQVLLSKSIFDTPLSLALILLLCSLPLTALSLFFSFMKQQFKIPTYGNIHSWLSLLALVTGTLALDQAIWHVALSAGILFLCLAVAAYIWAGFYLMLVKAAFRFMTLQNPPDAEKNEQE